MARRASDNAPSFAPSRVRERLERIRSALVRTGPDPRRRPFLDDLEAAGVLQAAPEGTADVGAGGLLITIEETPAQARAVTEALARHAGYLRDAEANGATIIRIRLEQPEPKPFPWTPEVEA